MAVPTPRVDRRGASRTIQMKVLVLGYFRTGTAYRPRQPTRGSICGPRPSTRNSSGRENRIERRSGINLPGARFQTYFGTQLTEGTHRRVSRGKNRADQPRSSQLVEILQRSLQAMYRPKKVRLACWLDPHHLGKVLNFTNLTVTIMIGPVADAKEEFKKRFVVHCEKVQKIVPKERLLEYEVGEGWDRLCAFLGNDVPKTEFPRVNDAKAILQNSDT
ncbi:hypothetical protein C8J57DRAFT_1213431 [Mycena rebaudengoi]|nr:hypothetical protein C8J57DRAFT_1213431 [Mycena rebaudengoi]